MQPNTAVFVAPAGRILLSLIFVMSAFAKFSNWQGPIAMMTDKGVPMPDVLLSIAVVLELLGGLLVLVGFQARWGAAMLIVFLIPVTLVMHNFWGAPPEQQQMQMINFMKNVCITGGLLYVLAFGAGPVSIDSLRLRRLYRTAAASTA